MYSRNTVCMFPMWSHRNNFQKIRIQGHRLNKITATQSSILAWKIPWTEEPGGLQSMGSQRFGHNRVTNTHSFTKGNQAWKDAQHHSLSEKCKSKPQWDTISRQSEWLQSKSLQAINAGEGVEKREPSYTVGGNAN